MVKTHDAKPTSLTKTVDLVGTSTVALGQKTPVSSVDGNIRYLFSLT